MNRHEELVEKIVENDLAKEILTDYDAINYDEELRKMVFAMDEEELNSLEETLDEKI